MDNRRAVDPSDTLAERARRLWRLRRHVVAVFLACFALFFGVMAIRMSVGDDPALGSSTGTSSTGAAATNLRELDAEEAQEQPEGESSVGGGSGPLEGFDESEEPSVEGRPLFGEGEQQIEPEAMHSGQS